MKMEYDDFVQQMNSLNWSLISQKIFDELTIDEERMPLTDFAERVTHCSLNISVILLREYNNWLMKQLDVETTSSK